MGRILGLDIERVDELECILPRHGVASRGARKPSHEMKDRRSVQTIELAGQILLVVGRVGEHKRLALPREALLVDRALRHKVERRRHVEFEASHLG